MKKKIRLIIVLAALVVIMACGKPSVENETNKYNYHQKNIKQLAAKYPAFRPFMVIVSNESYKLVTESQKIEDQVKKAEKIVEANKVFIDSQLYSQLNSFDGRFESTKRKRTELTSIRSQQHKTTIANAISKANQALVDATGIMKNAKPADMEAAVAELKKANEILRDAEYKLDSARRLTKKKKKK